CLELRLLHIFGEANLVADRLVGHAVSSRRSMDFSLDLKLPCEAGLALFYDQRGLPV
ncbi:unnamed protein product, partial [Ilex paraguariensis]